MACFEDETRLIAALGQGQGNSLKFSKGQLALFKYVPGTFPMKLSMCCVLKLPTGSRPQRVSLDADGKILACVTTIQNKLFVRHLGDDLSASNEPFEFVKNHYCVVSTLDATLSIHQYN